MGSVTTDARSAVVLGVVSKDIGIRFGDTESLVSLLGRVVANMDHTLSITTRIVFSETEVSSLGLLRGFLGSKRLLASVVRPVAP